MDTGTSSIDPWSEIIATEHKNTKEHDNHSRIALIYQRKLIDQAAKFNEESKKIDVSLWNRRSLAPNKRVSWKRSLYTRGRTSISTAAFVNNQHHDKQKRNKKPIVPKAKYFQPPNFEKEKVYFHEVDSFELLEESPSPKQFSTWVMGMNTDAIVIPPLSSLLQKLLISRTLNESHMHLNSLSGILECSELNGFRRHDSVNSKAIENRSFRGLFNSSISGKGDLERELSLDNSNSELLIHCDLEAAVRRPDVPGDPGLCSSYREPFSALLEVCEQSDPLSLSTVLSEYCAPERILKIGEGTYGEAFSIGEYVCKIVPIDGDFRVNGEIQKRSDELLEEVILSKSLNNLRNDVVQNHNYCSCFIKTICLRVCKGVYDHSLVKAWEDWDVNHNSENDNPKEFPEGQCYVVFVLEHGGQDLETFVLLNFDEARSLLVQVTVALAVAEACFEFEHRDLHWGNILLARREDEVMQFTLEGRRYRVNTFGIFTSIIDFTLSRINIGEDILFLDLSSDAELFEGPKGDKQAETYRRMREITGDCWEQSFLKTNVLWIQYLVDILLLKKSFRRTSKDERELRSLRKRLNVCTSAKEAIEDIFFKDMFEEGDVNHISKQLESLTV